MSDEGSGRDFYTVLAAHYDRLFGCSETLTRFLVEEGAVTGACTLDVACGTGACTRALRGQGVDCYGVDLSGSMIERAVRLAAASGIDPSCFSVADMLEVDLHPAAPFDLVFCVGNSIAHLPSTGDVERFAGAARRALGRVDGARRPALVVQFVAVDGLAVGDSFDLPDLEADDVVMRRRYRRTSDGYITFEASLQVGDSEPTPVSQRLLVLETRGVESILDRAGFGERTLFGGFDRSPVWAGTWIRVYVARP